ncbi:DUF2189 domain-containing protein [Hoeflea sp. CAU 1731]
MAAGQQEHYSAQPIKLAVKAATFGDVKLALRAGAQDFLARPGLSLFFGLFYALLGAVLLSGFLVFQQIWFVVLVSVGFPLVAPFLAAGLYEMSRRLACSEPFTASDIFLVVFNQQRREFGWMAFVVLFVFWIWAYQVRLLFAIFLQWQSVSSMNDLVAVVLTTSEGAGFLIVGTLVGAFLATVLYSITVIGMPLLLDKDVDFVTAMITSLKTVHKSPMVMLGWGAIIGALTLLAVAPLLLGVIFIFPILGHATWHLYQRLVHEAG